jgi:hypothetical protein
MSIEMQDFPVAETVNVYSGDTCSTAGLPETAILPLYPSLPRLSFGVMGEDLIAEHTRQSAVPGRFWLSGQVNRCARAGAG